jgi:hypothetical protein
MEAAPLASERRSDGGYPVNGGRLWTPRTSILLVALLAHEPR